MYSNNHLLSSASVFMIMLLQACASIEQDLTVISGDGTTVSFEWTTPEPDAEAVLEFGVDGGYEHALLLTNGLTTGPIVGLPPNTDIDYRLTTTIDGQGIEPLTGTFTTDQVPADYPDLNVAAYTEGAATDGYLMATVIGNVVAPVILDTEGRFVWWHTEGSTEILCTSSALSRDGESVLYLVYPAVEAEERESDMRELVRMPLDGSPETRLEAFMGHHDFTELPDGSIAFLSEETATRDGVSYDGDTIMEMAPDGSTTKVWSAWDELADENQDWSFNEGYGWSHANAIAYDEEDDAYYVSFRSLNTIVKIDRASGLILWRLGGYNSDFYIHGRPFSYQHNFHVLENSIVIFDNTEQDTGVSRAVEYELDFDQWEANEIWTFTPDPTIWTASLGSVYREPDGNTQVAWGISGRYDQITPDGELVLRIETGLGAAWGYHHWLGDFNDLNSHLDLE